MGRRAVITPAAARQLIEDETQWLASPGLSVAEVDRLLAGAQTIDLAGLLPGDPGYVETYTTSSLWTAIASGWRWKQGKVAGLVDLTAGDVSLRRSQAFDQLARHADEVARRSSGATGGSASGVGVLTITTAPAWWPWKADSGSPFPPYPSEG